MQHSLALFPLSLSAYPGQSLNLHIFEPRYKELINDCSMEKINFGLPPFIQGQTMSIGTEMKLIKIHKVYDNGSMDVSTLGMRVFKIVEFQSSYLDKKYAGGIVEYLANDLSPTTEIYPKILELLKELYSVFNISKPIPDLNEKFRSYSVAHNVGFTLDQEIDFLHLDNEFDRCTMVIEQLQSFIPRAKELELIRKKIQMNGHFKNVIPPPANQF